MQVLSVKKTFIFVILTLITTLTATAEVPVQVTTVLRSDKAWDNATLPLFGLGPVEMTVNEYIIQPGAKTAIHKHPTNGSGYVIEGKLTMVITTDPHGDFTDQSKLTTITLQKGQAWNESVNKWHYGTNNETTPVKFVVVFATEKEIPASISLSQ